MHRMQSGGWPYSEVGRDFSKTPSFRLCVCLCTSVNVISTIYTAVRHYFGMYIVGDFQFVRGTISGATRIECLHDGAVVESVMGSQLTIRLSINDSIHHNVYDCRGYNDSTVVGGFNLTTIVNGMYVLSLGFLTQWSLSNMVHVRYMQTTNINCYFFYSAKYCIDYHCQCCVSSHFGPEPQTSLFSF